MTDLERAKEALVSFINEEYDVEEYEARREVELLDNIGVCFTTTENDYHEIQWYVDLTKLRLRLEIDGKPFYEEAYDGMASMADACEGLNFQELYGEAQTRVDDWLEDKEVEYDVYVGVSEGHGDKFTFKKEEDALELYRERGGSRDCYIIQRIVGEEEKDV